MLVRIPYGLYDTNTVLGRLGGTLEHAPSLATCCCGDEVAHGPHLFHRPVLALTPCVRVSLALVVLAYSP